MGVYHRLKILARTFCVSSVTRWCRRWGKRERGQIWRFWRHKMRDLGLNWRDCAVKGTLFLQCAVRKENPHPFKVFNGLRHPWIGCEARRRSGVGARFRASLGGRPAEPKPERAETGWLTEVFAGRSFRCPETANSFNCLATNRLIKPNTPTSLAFNAGGQLHLEVQQH